MPFHNSAILFPFLPTAADNPLPASPQLSGPRSAACDWLGIPTSVGWLWLRPSQQHPAPSSRAERSSVSHTTATVTPSAVDTVRTQFLPEHDTNRAAILLVSSAPLDSFSWNRNRRGWGFVAEVEPWGGRGARCGTLEMRGVRGRAGSAFSWMGRASGMERRDLGQRCR